MICKVFSTQKRYYQMLHYPCMLALVIFNCFCATVSGTVAQRTVAMCLLTCVFLGVDKVSCVVLIQVYCSLLINFRVCRHPIVMSSQMKHLITCTFKNKNTSLIRAQDKIKDTRLFILTVTEFKTGHFGLKPHLMSCLLTVTY